MRHTSRRRAAPAGLCLALIACVVLAACGGSSARGGGARRAATTTRTTGRLNRGSFGALSKAAQDRIYRHVLSQYTACMRREGVHVGERPAASGSGLEIAPSLRERSSPKYRSADAACAKALDEALRIAAGKAYAKGKSR
jgi:hypothetical protein